MSIFLFPFYWVCHESCFFLYFDAVRQSRGTLRGSSGLHEVNLHHQEGLAHFLIEGLLRFLMK